MTWPKRTRIQSRKAQENQVQSQLFEVLFLWSITPTVSTSNEQKPVFNKYFLSIKNDTSQLKRRRSLNRQNSSQSTVTSNVIHKRLVHTNVWYTFLLHRDLLTIVHSHNTTTRWTLNPKKPEFSLSSRLSVQTSKCRSDVLQRRTMSLKPSSAIEWRTIS